MMRDVLKQMTGLMVSGLLVVGMLCGCSSSTSSLDDTKEISVVNTESLVVVEDSSMGGVSDDNALVDKEDSVLLSGLLKTLLSGNGISKSNLTEKLKVEGFDISDIDNTIIEIDPDFSVQALKRLVILNKADISGKSEKTLKNVGFSDEEIDFAIENIESEQLQKILDDEFVKYALTTDETKAVASYRWKETKDSESSKLEGNSEAVEESMDRNVGSHNEETTDESSNDAKENDGPGQEEMNVGGNQNQDEPAPPPSAAATHEHSWVPVTQMVHHDEEGYWGTELIQEGWMEHKLVREAYDEEVPVYETVGVVCCYCGLRFDSTAEYTQHVMSLDDEHMSDEEFMNHGSWVEGEERQVGTEIVHHEAEYEDIWHDTEYADTVWNVTKPAYDEEVLIGWICSECGETQPVFNMFGY